MLLFIFRYAYVCVHSDVQLQLLKDQELMWGQTGLFVKVCDAVKKFGGSRKTSFARDELSRLVPKLPLGTAMPFDPRIRLGELQVEECKVMSSAKKPLWLVFNNAGMCVCVFVCAHAFTSLVCV